MTLLLKETLEQRTLRIADQLQPEIQRTFLAAVETAKRSIPIGELSDFFEVGDIQGALEAAGITLTAAELQPITEAILQTTLKTAELAAIDLNLEFALVNERAVRFATEEAARLVTSISSETEKAIRDIVVRGQREGLNVRLQAQHIRRIVGNTDRDARAIDRFYVSLLDRETSTISLKRAGELADRMSARLLKRRAENIARTETIRAANMGNQLSWQTAMDSGLLPQTTRKVWIATADSRTCPICAVLHDQTISVSSTFDISERATSFERTGGGESLDFQVASKVPLKNPSAERQPPAHPSCRCTTGLEFAEGEPVEEPSSCWLGGGPIQIPKIRGPLSKVIDLIKQGCMIQEELEPTGRRQFRQDITERIKRLKDRYGPKTAQRNLLAWVDKWTNADSFVRFRKDVSSILSGTADFTKPAIKRARAILKAIDSSPYQKPDSLWRGMSIKGKADDLIGQFQPGSRLDLNISSFSGKRTVADKFMKTTHTSGKTQVRLEWLESGKAMPIQNISEFVDEFEWVGGGQFEVIAARKDSGRLLLKVRQVESLGLGPA